MRPGTMHSTRLVPTSASMSLSSFGLVLKYFLSLFLVLGSAQERSSLDHQLLEKAALNRLSHFCLCCLIPESKENCPEPSVNSMALPQMLMPNCESASRKSSRASVFKLSWWSSSCANLVFISMFSICFQAIALRLLLGSVFETCHISFLTVCA